MTQTILTLNAEQDRRVHALLKRLASDGPEMVRHDDREAADLLVKYEYAEYTRGGSHVAATPKGVEESKARLLRRP